MEPRGRNRWQPVANRIAPDPAKQAKNGCPPLQSDGKEGVDGSSPSEGFAVQPAISAFLLSALTLI
jgi:hypothetical protein